MLLFYVVAGAVALLVGLALARPLIGGAGAVSSREAADADLYRDQLAEIDRDLERGAISPAEAEGARTEVSRRLLGADGRAARSGRLTAAPRRQAQLGAGIALIGAPLLAVAVYLGVGAPGMAERGMAERGGAERAQQAERLSQAEAEALVPERRREPPSAEMSGEMQQYAELIQQLESVLEQRPNDLRGLEMLANGYGRLGRHKDAWRAWRRLIEAAGQGSDEGAQAEHYARMAEAMVMATDGYVSPEAEAALDRALARRPDLVVARYYDALAMAQGGRLDAAIAAWERLKAETPPDAPRYAFLERTLAEARALRDGGRSGPTREEIAAAEEMSPADREAMIEGMVARLERRLISEGGEPEEWVRLMNAYVQLDRPEDAERIARLGIESFGSGSEAGFVREQALLMGLDPE